MKAIPVTVLSNMIYMAFVWGMHTLYVASYSLFSSSVECILSQTKPLCSD